MTIQNKIEKNRDTHLRFYNYSHPVRDRYTKKKYDRRLTNKDIKSIESKFAFKKNPMTFKHGLLIILFLVIILLLCAVNGYYQDRSVFLGFSVLFVLLLIAMGYDVNTRFYWTFFVLFIIVIFYSSFINNKNESELRLKINIKNNKK
jgi:ABC-type multidrug transport system fused ATPase/permease subunit